MCLFITLETKAHLLVSHDFFKTTPKTQLNVQMWPPAPSPEYCYNKHGLNATTPSPNTTYHKHWLDHLSHWLKQSVTCTDSINLSWINSNASCHRHIETNLFLLKHTVILYGSQKQRNTDYWVFRPRKTDHVIHRITHVTICSQHRIFNRKFTSKCFHSR